MSQKGIKVHPVRRRAGYLSALSKLYKSVQRLVDIEGSTEDALELQEKLNVRYAKYLESHETALALQPEREVSLNESHLDIEKRHREAAEQLRAYIDDCNKSERSMRVRNLFSSKSSLAGTTKTASTRHSSRHSIRSHISNSNRSSRQSVHSHMSNSERLSEARVQAELAKTNLEQYRALQEANQKKLAAERETSRRQMEFERQEAQRKLELDREASQRKLDLERQRLEFEKQSQRREEELKQADIRRKQLQLETERQQEELEEELELQRQLAEYERRRAEVNIRQREEMRSEFRSDFESSDEEIERDVTKPKVVTKKNTLRFQPDDVQQASMLKILDSYSKPLETTEVTPQRAVKNWLEKSDEFESQNLKVPYNTPAQPHEGYVPPIPTRRDGASGQPCEGHVRQTETLRDAFNSQSKPEKTAEVKTHDTSQTLNIRSRGECGSLQGKSDAALFSRVLQENRLPKPKMMTFDGDPKRYKLFMASFRNNVEALLDGDDQLKLNLLLDQCTGEAFELIEECVMLKPDQGYRTAVEKLERRFGKNHLIARSYIDGVKKGGTIKTNDVKALVKLADDMRKCQNVLTELRFASDLDSTGTIESIIDRLPDAFQNQWVKRSNKILNMGREPMFQDLTAFVEERADDCNSKYGQYIAEKRSAAASSKPRQHEK